MPLFGWGPCPPVLQRPHQILLLPGTEAKVTATSSPLPVPYTLKFPFSEAHEFESRFPELA